MTKVQEKTLHFVTALLDAYRDEDSRELAAFDKLEFSDDVMDDFTAMLIAMMVIFGEVAGRDGDLIDFTHVLNKLAVQYALGGKGGSGH